MTSENTHPEELLPWYVNQTLGPAEREYVESHLAQCEHCRDEVALMRKMRAQIKQSHVTASNEFGLERLKRDIRREQRPTIGNPAWLRPALAAGVLLIMVQSALLINYWPESSGLVPLGEQYNGVVLQVRFVATATEAEISGTLREIDATLVDGPSSLGIYRLKLNIDPNKPQLIGERVHALRAKKTVITHVAQE